MSFPLRTTESEWRDAAIAHRNDPDMSYGWTIQDRLEAAHRCELYADAGEPVDLYGYYDCDPGEPLDLYCDYYYET